MVESLSAVLSFDESIAESFLGRPRPLFLGGGSIFSVALHFADTLGGGSVFSVSL